ncbi:MAG: hypothetical protein WCK51_11990 [Armatimonadota bacterium]
MSAFGEAQKLVSEMTLGDADTALLALEGLLRESEIAENSGQQMCLESNFRLALFQLAAKSGSRDRANGLTSQLLEGYDKMVAWIDALSEPKSVDWASSEFGTSAKVEMDCHSPTSEFPLFKINVFDSPIIETTLEIPVPDFLDHFLRRATIESEAYQMFPIMNEKSVIVVGQATYHFSPVPIQSWLKRIA